MLRETVNSGGQNLVKGLNNLLEDLTRGDGEQLRVQNDRHRGVHASARTSARPPGKVVFQNEIMQLIQYAPLTDEGHATPLLIIPPWINKFYILDMRENNSFVRWAVAQGHTVFMVSWVNPDERLAHKSFDDYLAGGLAGGARRDRARHTGERRSTSSATVSAARCWPAPWPGSQPKKTERIRSATFFVTMIDFERPGELEVFIDEQQVAALEKKMEQRGYLEGSRDGDDLQHAARQRPDLVVRRQQLPAGQGSVPVRPAVLELGFDAHAGGDAQLLPAQHVSEEPAAASPAASRSPACRST